MNIQEKYHIGAGDKQSHCLQAELTKYSWDLAYAWMNGRTDAILLSTFLLQKIQPKKYNLQRDLLKMSYISSDVKLIETDYWQISGNRYLKNLAKLILLIYPVILNLTDQQVFTLCSVKKDHSIKKTLMMISQDNLFR